MPKLSWDGFPLPNRTKPVKCARRGCKETFLVNPKGRPRKYHAQRCQDLDWRAKRRREGLKRKQALKAKRTS